MFEQAWERVERGNRQAVFIGGEPGAGKTRLAAEVAGTLVRPRRRGAGGKFDRRRGPALRALRRSARPAADRRSAGFDGGTAERRGTAVAAGCRRKWIGICPTTARPPDVGRRAAGPLRRVDRVPAASGGRSPDRVDPRRPALGAAPHARAARARADRLRRCARAGGGHVPHDRARPVRRAGHPAGRAAPVRRGAAPGPGGPRHGGDRRVRGTNPAAGPGIGAHGRRATARENRRQSVLPDRTGQRPRNPRRAGHVELRSRRSRHRSETPSPAASPGWGPACVRSSSRRRCWARRSTCRRSSRRARRRSARRWRRSIRPRPSGWSARCTTPTANSRSCTR